MAKKLALGSLAVFVLWEVLDFVIHRVILKGAYATMSNLMRPEAEIKIGLLLVVTLISAVVFTYVYAALVNPKSMANAVKYGLLLGIGMGVGMGYATYAVQPIPYSVALTWFLGTIVETTLAGVLLGMLVKD
ncbi:MAG: hypothetical protein D6681_03330 [Calditrichaeota bacterium]|nr:MAG: hypothetical protein D6681_03330 [Calditrichota bacterium]